ncbi:MAG: DUF2269 domain-containing protein [Thermoanaerobaculia bacterium]|nr:DUF2269 domain-containing protein [Thermoanaerobaculia bacterium]
MHFVQLILFLHVLAALWLAVGALGSLVVRGRLTSDLDDAALRFGIGILSRLHRLYTLPGVVASGLLGFSLVTATGYQFTQLWIAGAALLYVLLFHVTLFGLSPRLAHLQRVSKDDPGQALRSRVEQAGWRRLLDLQALLLVGIVLLMTVKP